MVGIIGRNFVGALLAGVTSAVIWMAMGLIVGMEGAVIGLWGLVFLVGVMLITFVISSVVGRGRGAA